MLVFGHPPDLSELLVFSVIFLILFHIPKDRWTPGIPSGPHRIPEPPEFPVDSPWVTSVGGTMLGHHKTNISQEVVWNDGIIGSGGGFSNRFSRPR